jgi:glutathione synthase/RimK-type ligase-like ATP-grasp enzyme
MQKICLLTCKENNQITDDSLLIDELRKSGRYTVENIPWDEDHDWSTFDMVIIRTTWDYTQRIEEFLAKMTLINSKTRLINSLSVVKWNHHKGYLKELEEKDVLIVPTVFFTFPQKVLIPLGWKQDKFIIKPCVSASSYNTFVVSRGELEDESYRSKLFNTDWMLQPFMEEILKGEISLHFFNSHFSHAIIKVPKAGDFRVQEEYGGNIVPYTPSEYLLSEAKKILSHINEPLLFARVDVVPMNNDFALMELELIEPSLYFRKDPGSPARFVEALDKFQNPNKKI